MTFYDILKDLVEGVEGGSAATLMGMDGVAIHKYAREGSECDVETIGIEYGRVVSATNNAAQILSLGDFEEMTVVMRGLTLILRMVTPQYYIVFAVDEKTAAGKARFRVRKAAVMSKKELEA